MANNSCNDVLRLTMVRMIHLPFAAVNYTYEAISSAAGSVGGFLYARAASAGSAGLGAIQNYGENYLNREMQAQADKRPLIVQRHTATLPLPAQAAASIISQQLTAPILAFTAPNGAAIDLNPLHWQANSQASASLQQTDSSSLSPISTSCSSASIAGSLPLPSSTSSRAETFPQASLAFSPISTSAAASRFAGSLPLPSPGVALAALPSNPSSFPSTLPASPSAASSIIPSPIVSPAPAQSVQQNSPAATPATDTDSAEMEKFSALTKKEAREKLYPVLQAYTRLMLIIDDFEIADEKVKEACLQEAMAKFVKPNADGTFKEEIDLNELRRILQSHGVVLSFCQKHFWLKPWLRFKLWVGLDSLLSCSFDMMIEKAYFHLFGENGVNQQHTIVEATAGLASFLQKYVRIARGYENTPTFQVTGKSRNDFLKRMIETEKFISLRSGKKINKTELYSLFTAEKIRQFLKSALRYKLKFNETTRWYHLHKTIPYILIYILGVLGILTEKKNISKMLEKSVETALKTMLDRSAQFAMKKNTLDLLKQAQKELELNKPSSPLTLRFQAGNDAYVHLNVQTISDKLSQMLTLELPNLKIEKNTPLENLLQILPFKLGEKLVAEIFNSAMKSVVPEAILTSFGKFLHPNEIHANMKLALDNTVKALREPSIPIDPAQELALDQEIESTLDALSKTILKNVVTKQIVEQLDIARASYAQGLVPPNITIERDIAAINLEIRNKEALLQMLRAGNYPGLSAAEIAQKIVAAEQELTLLRQRKTELEGRKANQYDLEAILLHSLAPRLKALLKRALNLSGDESFLRGLTYKMMAQVI